MSCWGKVVTLLRVVVKKVVRDSASLAMRTAGVVALAATVSLAVPVPAEAQCVCAVTGRGAWSFATAPVPFGDDAERRLDGRGGFGLGFEYGNALVAGADMEVEYKELWGTLYLLAGVGPRLVLGESDDAPWLQVTGQAGRFLVVESGAIAPVGRSFGEQVEPGRGGWAVAGRLRLGLPISARWAFVADGSVRVSFISTRRFPEGRGTFAEPRIPVAVGFRLAF